MVKPTFAIYACSMYLFTAASALFGKTSCAPLEGAKPEAYLAYLQPDRKQLDVNCALFAIVHLGTEHYAPASKTLVRYLDYRVPDDPLSKLFSDHTWWGTAYPAITALFMIGESAVPDVITVIADKDTADLIRENAIAALRAIYRERPPESVATLARAAMELSKSDAVAGNRLWKAARDVAAMCLDRHNTDCYAAAIQ